MSSKEYTLFNVLFVAFLICIFVLPLLIGQGDSFISCQILEATGEVCSSCGLTRDFSSFLHLDFKSPINEQSIFVFIWFVFQLIVRVVLVMLSSIVSTKMMIYDMFISMLSGIMVFLPFWI